MKTSPSLLLGCLVLVAGPLWAETDIGRELNQLQDEHTKAVAGAVEPLNRRYQTALEQLLKRATQSNDLDSALRIREQLTAFETAAATASAKPHYTKQTLPQFLTTSEWTWSAKPAFDRSETTHVTFTKDQFVMSGRVYCAYKIIDGVTVQLDKKTLKFADDYKSFEVADWSDGTPRYGHRVN